MELLPYNFVFLDDDLNTFTFVNDHLLTYEVRFKESGYIFPDEPDLWPFVFEMVIVLVDRGLSPKTPLDRRIPPTVAAIFKTFLLRNERIIVYICDSSDKRETIRARKFDTWFDYYQGMEFTKINQNIIDPSGIVYLTSLITRRDNPLKIRMITAFDKLIFGANDK